MLRVVKKAAKILVPVAGAVGTKSLVNMKDYQRVGPDSDLKLEFDNSDKNKSRAGLGRGEGLDDGNRDGFREEG